ncbi:SEC-C domain-containing protein, partial [Enterococcus faecalis]|nr:SEC-C domain-containing protein [Enterococcus faecalis]
ILSGCIPHLNVKTNIGSKHSVKKKKIGRNDPCYCGSGKKYKKCCLNS